MFQFSLSELMLQILREYNEYLGLNNPPPTAQMYNALAMYIDKLKKVVERNEEIANSDKVEILSKIDQEKEMIMSVIGEESERLDALYNRVEADENFSFSFVKGDTSTEIIMQHSSGDYIVAKIYNQDAQQLSNSIEGSDTVVVDINENGDKLEIHLDSEIVNKVERALLMPSSMVTTAIELVGVGGGNTQKMVRLGSGLTYDSSTQTISAENGGGGSQNSKIYRHTILFWQEPGLIDPPPHAFKCHIVNSVATPYTNIFEALDELPLWTIGGYAGTSPTVHQGGDNTVVYNGYSYNTEYGLYEMYLFSILQYSSLPILVSGIEDEVTEI